MASYFSTLIVTLVVVGVLKSATGLKWETITMGDALPTNTILIDDSSTDIVGRTMSSGDIYFPAKIDTKGEATIKPYRSAKEKKIHSQVLVTSHWDKCEWKSYSIHSTSIDMNAVRVGVDKGNDTIYIGRFYVRKNKKLLTSIYLPNKQETQQWSRVDYDDRDYLKWEYLSCDPSAVWVNSTASSVPDNAVKAGKIGDNPTYVARMIQSNKVILTGYVIPEKGATVFDESAHEESLNYYYDDEEDLPTSQFQILVGELDEYKWVTIKNGIIPDFAVANGKTKLEPMFIGRMEGSVRPFTQTEALKFQSGFDILVKNK